MPAYTPDSNYWAASDPESLGRTLLSKITDETKNALITSIRRRNARSYLYYFGFDPTGVHATSQVLRGGDQGELATVRVNHSRPLVNTLLNLIVAPKIVWSPKATNIDYDAVRECELASAVLEYYWQERQVAKYAVRALEEALVFSEGFVLEEWDPDAGKPYAVDPGPPPAPPQDPAAAMDPAAAPDTPPAPAPVDLSGGSLLKTGDVCFTNIPTWDVIRDATRPSWEELNWVLVRRQRNRYDMAARYPDKADAIINAPEDSRVNVNSPTGLTAEDAVTCWYFFHKRTPALKDGRQAVMLADGTVLSDSPLQYENLPLHRVSAGELVGTPYGYTPFLDILGIQEIGRAHV